MTHKALETAAALSAEHLGLLMNLTEAYLRRPDGLEPAAKLVVIQTAEIKHLKFAHQVFQATLGLESRVPFSVILRNLAEAEEREENEQKGGSAPPAG